MAKTDESGSNYAERVTEIQKAWLAHERERHVIANRRIRAVVEAVDLGHLSHRQVAEALAAAGKPFHQKHVTGILACGYPTDDLEDEPA